MNLILEIIYILKARKLLSLILMIVLISFLPTQKVIAQDSPENPVYIIQSGDTLGLIALRFGISIDDLINANEITNPNAITVGMNLIIPGLKGIEGTLITETIPLGENLSSLTLRYGLTEEILTRLNRIVTPGQIYAGSNLILPQDEDTNASLEPFSSLNFNQSLLELAAIKTINPWHMVLENQQISLWDTFPGETIYSKTISNSGQSIISPHLLEIAFDPLPLIQGSAAAIRLTTTQPMDISGSLGEKPLHFFSVGENQYAAYQGIHAIADTGLILLTLKGQSADGISFQFEQNILLYAGYYGSESIIVDSSYIDPIITEPEDEQIRNLINNTTPDKYWELPFLCPVDPPVCIRSWFGTRRSYNDGVLNSFHSGVDYGVCSTLNIYAPAAGLVVFSGPLEVRGNAVFIDHGWGIYSGIFHQSESYVKTGDFIEAGHLVGQIGGTGRVTGPHLHYELWVNGVRVQPLDWLDEYCQ
jgi:murein DD-endopeptidase MepM/ murein hydrolase activator NlpD